MEKLTQKQLNKYLSSHKEWLVSNRESGETFTVNDMDFSGLSFQNALLVGANLKASKFTNCDFSFANLESINVTESDFTGTNFTGANLRRCDFSFVEFDEKTKFLNVHVDGMMVDRSSISMFVALGLDTSKMVVVNPNSTAIDLNFTDELQGETQEEIVDFFLNSIKTKYEVSYVKKKGKNKTVIIISALNKDTIDAIEQDREMFGDIFRGQISLEDAIPNELHRHIFKRDLKRLQSRMEEKIADQQFILDIQKYTLQTFQSNVQKPAINIDEYIGKVVQETLAEIQNINNPALLLPPTPESVKLGKEEFLPDEIIYCEFKEKSGVSTTWQIYTVQNFNVGSTITEYNCKNIDILNKITSAKSNSKFFDSDRTTRIFNANFLTNVKRLGQRKYEITIKYEELEKQFEVPENVVVMNFIRQNKGR
jgi:Pentapeptide repeats (8 copies)